MICISSDSSNPASPVSAELKDEKKDVKEEEIKQEADSCLQAVSRPSKFSAKFNSSEMEKILKEFSTELPVMGDQFNPLGTAETFYGKYEAQRRETRITPKIPVGPKSPQCFRIETFITDATADFSWEGGKWKQLDEERKKAECHMRPIRRKVRDFSAEIHVLEQHLEEAERKRNQFRNHPDFRRPGAHIKDWLYIFSSKFKSSVKKYCSMLVFQFSKDRHIKDDKYTILFFFRYTDFKGDSFGRQK